MSPTNFELTWRKRFERFADYDDPARIAGWSEHSLQTRVNVFKQHWRKSLGTKWLDVGCGAGTYTQLLLNNKQQVIGVDYSYPTLKKAQQRLTKGTSLCSADVRQLPFQTKCFSGVLCFGVLQALQNPMLAIDEIHEALQPGGELWLDALNRGSLRFCYEWLKHKCFKKPYRLTYVSAKKLKQHLVNKGYQNIKIIWMPILPEKYDALQNELFVYIGQYGERYRFIWALISHAFLIKAQRAEG